MNTLSMNSPQLSFKGIIITPDNSIVQRPLTYVMLHIVPDSATRGVKVGNRTTSSNAADQLTQLFLSADSLRHINQDYISVTKLGKSRFIKIRERINQLINQINLKPFNKNEILQFMKNKKLAIRRTNNPNEYKLIFGDDRQGSFMDTIKKF